MSGGNQTLSSTPSQEVLLRGWQESPEGSSSCSQNPLPALICALLPWSMGSVDGRAKGNHLPSEQGSPSGEDTSSNAMSVPLGTSGRDGPGELPESFPEYTDYKSVMALYNTYSSILTAALSVTAPNEASEAEEEQGESSDYKCVLCEQVKEKPNP